MSVALSLEQLFWDVMICNAQGSIQFFKGIQNLPFCTVRCCHDPSFIDECAATVDFN